jgi:hypothetical protein
MIQKMNLEREGSKSASLTLATLAKPGSTSLRPITGPKPLGAARVPTSMWRLLVWAYRLQMVRYEVDRAIRPSRFGSLADELIARQARPSRGDTERGCINGAGTSAHADAHLVHGHVGALKPRERDLIIDTASNGLPPDWNPALPALRVVPIRKGPTGTLRMLYGRSHRPVACMIGYEGLPNDEIAQMRKSARDCYAMWWQVVRRLRLRMWDDRGLTRWKVTAIGAEREPWLNGA